MAELSTKPYLLRAIYEWCADNGYTPYIAVAVDERTRVPREYVRNGEIVLNVSATATNRLVIGNEVIEFQARFGGVPRELSIPVEQVSAIYARENGHGMAFDVPKPPAYPAEVPAAEGAPGAPGARERSAPRDATPPRDAGGARDASAPRTPRRAGTTPLTAVPTHGQRGEDEAAVPGDDASANGAATEAEGREPSTPAETPADRDANGGHHDDGPESGPHKPGRPRLTRIK